MTKSRTALVFGVSGIVGRNLAEHLLTEGKWTVIGVSRHSSPNLAGLQHVTADLNDAEECRKALANTAPATHVFYATWARQANETENCAVNGAMTRNALEAAAARGAVRHAVLVTGLKHYLGSFDNYGAQVLDTPFTEEQPRVPGENFYYTQEDILFEIARKYGFSWSVARPHTIIGYAPGNAMNLGTSLAVYASLCRETGRPFQFPGTPEQYGALVDMTSAELLAHHLTWEAMTKAAANQAFNVVNGDVFRWRKMWGRIAEFFEIPAAPYPGVAHPLEVSLADAGGDWKAIAKKYKLQTGDLRKIAPWWHVDADLGRTQECVTDMTKSRELGFLEYRSTWGAFQDLFHRLRKERVIP